MKNHSHPADILPYDLLERVATVLREVARRPFGAPEAISSGANPTTTLDQALSSELAERLVPLWDAQIFTEEDPRASAQTEGWQWVIDPLDGTINAINGSPDVAISIALRYLSRDTSQLAAVLLPHFNEMFTALEGRGAFRNGNRLEDRSPPPIRIAAIGINEYGQETAEHLGKKVGRSLGSGWILRQSGSAALDICRLASGTWTGFVELGLKAWDIAAADLIAREAGCVSTSRPTSVKSDWPEYSVDYVAARTPEHLDELANTWLF